MNNRNILPVLIQAIHHSNDGITISDASQPDMPLIYVNSGFEKMTGYSAAEIVGRNCRFLQGKKQQQPAVAQIKRAISEKENISVELLNYRKNGEPFWNKLSLTPIFDEHHQLTYIIGVQNDITHEKLAQKRKTQRAINRASIQIQEKERSYLGAELHDNINQLLVSAKLYLEASLQGDSVQEDMVWKSRSMIEKAITEVRKVSHALIGPHTGDIPLRELMEDLHWCLVNTTGLESSFHWEGVDEKVLSNETKLALYRILQEGMQNVVKHAKATTLSLSVSQHNGVLRLVLKDNGVGFNKNSRSRGVGLRNMTNRLALVEGKILFHTAPGKGCEMEVRIPL